MKWITLILMGIFIMGCAASPVVTNRQTMPNQYDIDKKKEPVITERELSENQFEITTKSGSDNFWWGCIEFMKYTNKLCEERTGKRAFKAKKTEVDTRGNNAIWTRVSIIECSPKGFWTKKNGDKSERQKDFYECNKDVHFFFDKRIASSNPCQLIELNEAYWNFFEFCLRSKGYEFVEKREREDLKPPSVNWDFLIESKAGDSKLYLDWDSVKWGYSGDDVTFQFGDDVTFRLKDEYTNGNYAILTLKYYCTKKKFVVMHGATYNREGQLIEDRSKWDEIPKDITSNVMGDLYDILCGPILKRKKEK